MSKTSNITENKSFLTNIFGLSLEDLQQKLQTDGIPKFRAKQIWGWLYERGICDFAMMTNLPKNLIAYLEENFYIGNMTVDIEQSSTDGTIKRLYKLRDGQLIESVLMPYQDGRRTACISSQAGCAMKCVFCATGQMGFVRHLQASEIYEQAHLYAHQLQKKGERLSNIVLMGMGEPFHNYDEVLKSIHMIQDRLGIGARRITISTVGIAPKIRQFAQEGLQVKLAISLHASQDEIRSPLMPINKKYPISELLSACREYVQKTNRRITFEWALIAGQNDQAEEAHRLGALLQGLECHVNLIPLNPTLGYDGSPTSLPQAQQFVQILQQYKIPATVRVRRGIDIDAGCGQLKSTRQNKEKI